MAIAVRGAREGFWTGVNTRAIAEPSFRQIRLSHDTGSIGAQGRPFLSAPRPFRLRLDESPLPLSPRPFRNVLE